MLSTHNPTLHQLLLAGATVKLPNGVTISVSDDKSQYVLQIKGDTIRRKLTDKDLQIGLTANQVAALVPDDRRQMLKDKFWSWVDASIEGYSKQIDDLLDELNGEQLEEFIAARVADDEEEEDDEEEGESIDIRYRCPECGHKWEEVWDCACDSQCENCGLKNISALTSKGQDEDWTPEQEEEWDICDDCECGHAREMHNSTTEGEVRKIGTCRSKGCKCSGYKVDMTKYN